LQTLAHDRLVSPDIERLLCQWVDPSTGEAADTPNDAWDESARALLREVWRDFSRAKKLPSDFVKRLSRESSLAQQVWVEARKKSDFRMFLPHLRTIVALKQEEAEYLGYCDTPYNALLDTYEPRATVAQLGPLFTALKTRLVPLLNRVLASSVRIDDSILFLQYDTHRQIEFGRLVLTAM
jgi:carboxypeptidase Taq